MLAYKTSPSPPFYTLVPSRSSAYSQYAVTKHSSGYYTVQKHISSSPIGTIMFSVKLIRGICIVRREYGSSGNVKAYYSISKRDGEFVLGCFHANVLEKVRGYSYEKLDRDTFVAFDVGLFVWKLAKMEGEAMRGA